MKVSRRPLGCVSPLLSVILMGAIACQGSGSNRKGTDASGGAGGSSESFGGAGGGHASGGAWGTGGTTSPGGAGGQSSDAGQAGGDTTPSGGAAGRGGSGGSSSTGGAGASGSSGGVAASGGSGGASSANKCEAGAALEGATWSKTNWSEEVSYFQLFAADDVVLARVWDSMNGGRVFVSSDHGETWSPSSADEADTDVLSMVLPAGNDILAATWGNSYRSTSGGKSWDVVTRSGIAADAALRSLTWIDGVLFAGTTGSVYKSSDSGATWTEVKSGLPEDATVLSIVGKGDTVFAGTDGGGVFVTKNGGTSWAAANAGLADLRISQLALSGARLFAVTMTGVFVSDDSGASWAADKSTLKGVNGYLALGSQLLAGTETQGAFFSSDGGNSWTALGAGLPEGARIWSLAAGRTGLYAGTSLGVWRASCE